MFYKLLLIIKLKVNNLLLVKPSKHPLYRIVNGGFEAALSSWNAQNVTIVNSPTNEGSSAARLEGGALNSFLIQIIGATGPACWNCFRTAV
jgi:hypothetical protein